MEIEKSLGTITVVKCDWCGKKINGLSKGSDLGFDACSICSELVPQDMKIHQDDILQAMYNHGERIPLDQFSHGYCVLFCGSEDAGVVECFDKLEDAKDFALEYSCETPDCSLIDIFHDGKAMGASIKMTVVFY